MEIEIGGLRHRLFDDFHEVLGKASAKNAPAFPPFPQRRLRFLLQKKKKNQTQHSFYSPCPLFHRKSKELGAMLPDLYLHGLAKGDFELALRGVIVVRRDETPDRQL